MVALEKKIDTDLTAEASTRKKLIESQTAQQFSNQKMTFINKLQELLDEVETPPALHFVQALSTNPDHCSAFECYRNSHFTSTETSLQITTQRYTLSLQQKTLLTCTLLHNNLLSAYHNQLAVIKDEEYITQSDLPPLPIATEDQKDFIARRPRDSDLLGKNILLIFDQEKMAVQCLKPQKLLLDSVELSCTNISLQWQQHPTIIKDVATQDVILGHQQYKATALRWSLQQEFEPMDLNTLLLKPLGGSVISDIKTFFEESNIYHVPIFGALGVILIILICTPCIVCLCCPACCAPFCYVCGGNRNPIVVHHARLQDKKRYATMIKHFGNPPETEEPPALEPKRSGQAIADQLVIRMKRLETQQRRTLISPLLPSAPPAETGFSNLEYESQPAYQETAASLA